MGYEEGKASWDENLRMAREAEPEEHRRAQGDPLRISRKALRQMVGCHDPIGDGLAEVISEAPETTYDQLATSSLDRMHPNWREVKDCQCGGEMEPVGDPYFVNISIRSEIGTLQGTPVGDKVRLLRCNRCKAQIEVPCS